MIDSLLITWSTWIALMLGVAFSGRSYSGILLIPIIFSVLLYICSLFAQSYLLIITLMVNLPILLLLAYTFISGMISDIKHSNI